MGSAAMNRMDPGVPLPRLTDYLDRYADEAPYRDAIVFDGQRLSYSDLRKQVDACAAGLLHAGMRHGDRVAMLCTSRPEFWIVFLACARIGAIWVGLNPRFREQEVDHVLADSQPSLLFTLARFEDVDHRGWITGAKARHASLKQIVYVGDAPAGETAFTTFVRAAAQPFSPDRLRVHPDDTVTIIYTSGSTGKPKGVQLTHRGLCIGSTVQLKQLELSRPRFVVCFPINHIACLGDCCSWVLAGGGAIVFQERFNPADVLDATQREHCNVLVGVPTMLQLLLAEQHARPRNLSQVELIVWGGAAMPAATVVELAKFGARLCAVYGSTETTVNVAFTPQGASPDVLANSIGRPPPEYPCRIVDGAGVDCPPGEPGELQFHGSYVMKGYWGNPEATAAAFTADGWLRTCDVGLWREDGCIALVGRIKEMFKSGGYNVYPREIETVLETHPAVAAAAVIGVPDPTFQEVGWAYVMPRSAQSSGAQLANALRDHCRAQLANYKVPKRFIVQDQLPVLSVGKIDKVALREAALRELEASFSERR
jgi:acyl-CoA synthetase (AMP-forming)/AMP-acid ligase II